MSESRFDLETRAYDAFQRVLAAGREAKELFDSASLPLPGPLARLVGDGAGEHRQVRTASVPPLASPPKPPEARPEWLWVPIADLLPTTLVKAILRREGTVVKPKALIDEIISVREDLSPGGIYNVGPRLDRMKQVTRDEHGWRLVDDVPAAVIHGENAWGPTEVFQKQELAAHRRLIILHLLNVYSDGLQIIQITNHLRSSDQCRAPVVKDLVKADLDAMLGEKKVRRIGNSRKWAAIKEG